MQITLTVAEAKRIIAKAIATLPEVQHAFRSGKILLKGGTTVSAVSEERARKEPYVHLACIYKMGPH